MELSSPQDDLILAKAFRSALAGSSNLFKSHHNDPQIKENLPSGETWEPADNIGHSGARPKQCNGVVRKKAPFLHKGPNERHTSSSSKDSDYKCKRLPTSKVSSIDTYKPPKLPKTLSETNKEYLPHGDSQVASEGHHILDEFIDIQDQMDLEVTLVGTSPSNIPTFTYYPQEEASKTKPDPVKPTRRTLVGNQRSRQSCHHKVHELLKG